MVIRGCNSHILVTPAIRVETYPLALSLAFGDSDLSLAISKNDRFPFV